MKKYLILIYPIVIALFYIMCWNIGNNDPANSFHSLAFLMNKDGAIFIFAIVAMLTFNVVAVVGTIGEWWEVVMEKRIWIAAIILAAAVVIIFVFNRSSCGHDINVGSRYQTFIKSKGWTN